MALARLRETVNSAVTGRLTPERTRSGWLPWRLQRELWRRDVERLSP